MIAQIQDNFFTEEECFDLINFFKQNKELQTHNKFLVERLERWAERNFQLRTDLMNSPMAEKINKLNEMIKEANENRP